MKAAVICVFASATKGAEPMRQFCKKTAVLLCALAFGVYALSPGAGAADVSESLFGLQSVHNSVSTTSAGDGYVSPLVTVKSGTSGSTVRTYKSTSIPSSYDLRSKNKLTAVRDQGSQSDCWAYAAYGSLESYLMPTVTDFSESVLAANAGFDLSTDDGGNDVMATAYLARWDGPVSEGSTSTSGAQKHVQNVDWLAGRTGSSTSASVDDAIKEAVMEYGAVFAPLYYDDVDNAGTSSYYNETTDSYYYNGSSSVSPNHAVDIVGWDDSYSASNFTKTPSRNGAFLCRNSWGRDWGDGGYFYVSYDDVLLGNEQCSVFDSAESTDHYTYNYQYDPLGLTSYATIGEENNWMANVFTAQSGDPLAAAAFYTLEAGVSYNVYVASVSSDGTPSANATKVASGTMENAGYHTVKFNNTVSLSAGQKFAVEVELIGGDSQIALEEPVSGYSSRASASAGQSFISADGSSWSDTTTAFSSGNGWGRRPNTTSNSNVNVCLKAFTVAASGTSGSSSASSASSSSASSGSSSASSSSASSGSSSASSSSASSASGNPSLATMTTIDTPAGGSTLTRQTFPVSGWALNGMGVSRVDVYAFDSAGGAHALGSVSAASFTARTDVLAAFPAYGTLKSGYSLTVDAAALTPGTYTIAAAAIGSDGRVQWATRAVTIGPEAQTTIDTPAANAAVSGSSLTVSGWALNHSGISRVDMYLFDSSGTAHALGSVFAVSMYARADVTRAFPAYVMTESGYTGTFSLSGLAAGRYTLAVAGIGVDGDVKWATISIRLS